MWERRLLVGESFGRRLCQLFGVREKTVVRGGERTCRESLVKRPCVKEKDGELGVDNGEWMSSSRSGWWFEEERGGVGEWWLHGGSWYGAQLVRRRVEPSSFVVVRALASESALSAAGPCV